MAVIPHLPPHLPARLAAYYFAYFTYAGALVPYFSLWLAAQGFGAAQIALVLAMPQIARLFAPSLWGWLADHTGRQREIVIFGAFAVFLGFAALYAVRGVAAVALVMLVLSVLAAGAMPLVEAAALAATQGRAGQYGPIRLWGSIGFILAVLGTGAWLDHHGAETVLDIVVLLAAVVCAVSLGIPARARPPAEVSSERIGAVLARSDVLAFFGACMCMSVAHGAMYAFYSIYLEAAGYSKAMIGVLWTLGVVAEVVVFLRLPQLMRRFSLRTLLIASFACAALRFAAIGWAVDLLVVLVIAQLLHAATFGAFHAASIAAVHRLFPGRIAARGQAIYSSLTYGLGGAAGTLIAGWTWEALGPSPSFAVSALFGAFGALLVAWKVRV
jgi:MFS transporter, PPP family, 3-phenylpropionic acid transporter